MFDRLNSIREYILNEFAHARKTLILDNKGKIIKVLKSVGLVSLDIDLTKDQLEIIKEKSESAYKKIKDFYLIDKNKFVKHELKRFSLVGGDKIYLDKVLKQDLSEDKTTEPVIFDDLTKSIITLLEEPTQKKDILSIRPNEINDVTKRLVNLVRNGYIKEVLVDKNCECYQATDRGVNELIKYLCDKNNLSLNQVINILESCKNGCLHQDFIPKNIARLLEKEGLILGTNIEKSKLSEKAYISWLYTRHA